MLEIDSTTGLEQGFAAWCYEHLEAPTKQLFRLGGDQCAVLLSWSEKCKFVMCSHLDTVPPYIAPSFEGDLISGRGACDAKGQIWALYQACKELEARGRSDFALLLVSSEEQGSKGAKAWSAAMESGLGLRSAVAASIRDAEYLLIGEPTDCQLISASKGTQSYSLRFRGISCHSGYPHHGASAVDSFLDFCERLRSVAWEEDPRLGATTWNIGELSSGNPQNVLSAELSCRIYFRSTFASEQAIRTWMSAQASDNLEISGGDGDAPALYFVPEALESKAAAFGSDAPHLSGFSKKMICGPGSILVAHKENERVGEDELRKAVKQYIKIYEGCN